MTARHNLIGSGVLVRRLHKCSFLKPFLRLVLLMVVGFLTFLLVLSFLFPLRTDVPFAPIVTARDGTVLHAFLADDDKWRMKTELSEISPTLRSALLQKEDKWFYWHFGVNPFAIVRAAVNNLRHQKTTSGASTLTMQVARMLENQYTAQKEGNRKRPTQRERTVWNKIVEVFRALQLEITHSKSEILQLYLNLAPYGGNIEGVKAASLLYFGTLPEKLSLAQATTLAIIPNRPTTLKLDENNAVIRRERDKWLERFRAEGVFPSTQIDDALREPTDIQRHDAPTTIAPHFAYRMKRLLPLEFTIPTTLDTRKQQSVQTLTQNVIRRLKIYGINNAAVLVVNNQTREVEAYLGSPDYADKAASGEVDGVRAVRSPGSALKPLAYTLAMDKGLITPKTVLTDVPTNFDGYAPENFDRTYRGFVPAEKALINSLNIPAVKLVRSLGVAAFTEALTNAGFEQIRKDGKKLGLSVVLGGCGVRLEEMAGLYCAFANYGEWKSLVFRKDAVSNKALGTRLVSPSAAFMLGEILTQLTRPDVPRNFGSTRHLPKVAWKTGTSYGRRDAWSIGYNKRYTVAVWVGNFSGVGAPELVGADIATPLLFDIFNAIDYNSPNDWFQPPPELDFRLVCSESGLPPSDFCQNQVSEYYLPRISSNAKCQHLKEVAVSADEQISYCTDCLPPTGYKKKLYPNLPPEMLALYTAQNQAFERIPEHNPSCSRAVGGTAPTITSLTDGKEYLIEKSKSGQAASELLLTCHAANDVRTVYWFLNDKFLRAASPEERIFFTPERGQIKISCSDDKGRNSNIWITVMWQ
ncbi:MAG: penicillin-binding protein 1C [Ignavibacteria bacterium]|nr:penicillin-binding protein 1C [Ignavibacteria bacterium]